MKRVKIVSMLFLLTFMMTAVVSAEESKKANAIMGTPEVDGVVDDIWNLSSVNQITNFKGDTSDFGTGTFRVMWDNSYVYILTEVIDSNISTGDDGSPWNNSSVEMFIDQNNAKLPMYENDDAQYRVDADNVVTTGPNGQPILDLFKHGVTKTSDGYIVEAAIPVQDIDMAVGLILGLDVQINSVDVEDSRFMSYWSDSVDSTYKATSGFGNLELADKDIPTTGEESKVLYYLVILAAIGIISLNSRIFKNKQI